MRLMSLIGTIGVLVLPIVYISRSFGDALSYSTLLSFFWFSSEGQLFGFSRSETSFFNFDWLSDNDVYDYMFGDLKWLGIIVLGLLLVNIFISTTTTKKNNEALPAIILLICGILLLIIRFNVLGDINRSLYYHTDGFGSETYIELPIGFVVALVFSILDFRSK